MRLTYDGQVDALSLVFRDETADRSREIAPGLLVSLDRQGEVVAIEVLRARARIGKNGLSMIAIDLQDL